MALLLTPTTGACTCSTFRTRVVRRSTRVHADPGTKDRKDSFQVIEAEVRKPTAGIESIGGDVKDRQSEADDIFKSDTMNADREKLGLAVGTLDAFRFKGSLPEIANCRLGMIGATTAIIGELTTGRNIFQQVEAYPVTVASVFVLFTLASIIPQWRGVKRTGNGIWDPTTELITGRVAMTAFAIMLWNTYQRSSLFG